MSKRIASLGVYITFALILSYIEALIPLPLMIPGMKLGLANLIIVIGLMKFSKMECFAISMMRVIISSLLFGNIFAMAYSLAGAILSFLIMIIMLKLKGISLVSVSVMGAVFHNIGQIIMAILLLESVSLIYYLPALMISAIITGSVIGLISIEVVKRLRKI